MVRMDQKLDAERIKAYSNGDNLAFEALYRQYERPLYSFILRFVTTRNQADDLFQQTWLKVINGLPKYDEQGKFSSWLFGIANNCCIDAIRKNKPSRRVTGDEAERVLETMPDGAFDPETLAIKSEEKKLMQEGLAHIPEEQKQVLLLRIHGDMPFKEIASMLDCSINTVLGRMHYAVKNLRKTLQQNTREGFSNAVS